jgi:uncharacterized protein (TIGR02145 family)
MKRFFFFLIVLSVCSISFAQTSLIINKTNGTSASFLLTEIKNITFSGGETVADIDGNVYRTVKIGNQWWMAENLKVTRYRNGDAIPNVEDAGEWASLISGAYCYYDNDPSNADIYGRLYNWYAINDSRNIAPVGWHVPTDDEWKELEIFLGISPADVDGIDYRGTEEGGKLKEAGTSHWKSPNTGANNSSGFTALPGGSRKYDGEFPGVIGENALFWSSTIWDNNEPLYRYLSGGRADIYRQWWYRQCGFSIRCVKD